MIYDMYTKVVKDEYREYDNEQNGRDDIWSGSRFDREMRRKV